MPYGSVSLTAIWKVFWSLYSNHTDPTLSAYQTTSGHHDNSGSVEGDGVGAERGRSPETVEEIQQVLKSECIFQCINTPSSLSLKWRGGSNFLPSPIPLLIPPPPSFFFPSSLLFPFPPLYLFVLLPCFPPLSHLFLSYSPPPCQPNKDGNYKLQFVDCLMKTYTSEAVFLLTTFVNMARARPADSDQEKLFINTIALEIFEV